MKKLYTICLLVCFALSVYAETEFTFTSSADLNQEKDGITVTIAKGNGQTAPSATVDYQTQTPEMRLYVGNTITVSSSQTLTNIQMVFSMASSAKAYTELSASTGTLVSGGASTDKTDLKVDSWTGSATQVVFTLTEPGKQRQIKRILVDGEPIDIQPVEDILPTAQDLDPNYVYAEPTTVAPKDTTLWKKEFAFIDNNILVHCDMGSINPATDTTFAYFNCNANYSITFTATQPIKGISIDGFVRKAFDATCDKGEIQFMTDPDRDMEGWPALVIMDIDSTSVTLNCPKQLRCYAVRVFFEENPDPIEEGIDNISSEIKAQKVLQNGQLYIIKNGRVYTAEGTAVK